MLGQIKLRKEISDRLKKARLNAGFQTGEEFCKKHELNFTEYNNFENGDTTLRASQAMQFCSLLHISLHWLMLGEEYKPRSKSVEQSAKKVL